VRQVNIHEAKTHLSRLVEDVARGDEIIIAKAGKPMARLIGITAARQPRRRGLLKGQIRIAADFDAPLPAEVLAGFEGNL
jgi:prevent-host-death family protein